MSALETTYGELKATASFDCDGAKNATVKAIVGKPAEFDANYAAYEKFLTPEFRENVLQQQAVWAKYVPVRNKYRKVLD